MIEELELVRAVAAPFEVRAEDDDAPMPVMSTTFSVFDEWYEIDSYFEGKFMERTIRGAFADTIRDDIGDMKVLFDHGYDPSIGNKVLGPIRTLVEKKTGPYSEVPLLDTSYNRDLVPGLTAGVYGASFRFRVVGEEWDDDPGPSDYNPKGLPERTITKVKVYEFGPVTFPANPAATAGVRSLTDQFYEGLRSQNPDAYDRAVQLRTKSHPFVVEASARSTADDESETHPTIAHDLVRQFSQRTPLQ